MRTTTLIVASIISILYISCKSTSNPLDSAPPESYLPMAVGNAWVYHNWQVDSTGAIVPGSDQTEVDSLTDTATISGVHCFAMQPTINDTARATGYFAFDANGNPETFVDTSNGAGRGLWTPMALFSNTAAGNKVTSYTPLVAQGIPVVDTTDHIYVGTTSITVPAGTFGTKCYDDSSHGSASVAGYSGSIISATKTYFAPYVGRIKASTSTATTFTLPLVGTITTKVQSFAELVRYHVH